MSEEPEANPQHEIELDVINLVTQQKDLLSKESELMENPRFVEYIQAKKKLDAAEVVMWESIQQQMEKYDVKKIKGAWGSVTMVEKTTYKVPDITDLPAKFIKKMPDLKKIATHVKLTDKLPKGVETAPTRYLLKKIK
jgi:hypothetical protein